MKRNRWFMAPLSMLLVVAMLSSDVARATGVPPRPRRGVDYPVGPAGPAAQAEGMGKAFPAGPGPSSLVPTTSAGAQLSFRQSRTGRVSLTPRSPVPLEAGRDEATLVVVQQSQPALAGVEESPRQLVSGAVDEARPGSSFPTVAMSIVGTYTATLEMSLPPGDYSLDGTPAERFYSQPLRLSASAAGPSRPPGLCAPGSLSLVGPEALPARTELAGEIVPLGPGLSVNSGSGALTYTMASNSPSPTGNRSSRYQWNTTASTARATRAGDTGGRSTATTATRSRPTTT